MASPSSQARRPKRRFASANQITSVWFLLPILLIFGILVLVPLGQSLLWSFGDFNPYTGETTWVGLDNYSEVFSDSALLTGASFTLMYAVVVTLVTTMLAIPLSVFLNKKFFGRDFSRGLLFFFGVPSLAILGLVWRFFFNPLDTGVFNTILNFVGLDSQPWLADARQARFAVMFVGIWAGVGWHATLYLAYLQAIPKSLYEAARVDGANSLQQFTNITIPQLMPAIGVSTFLLVTHSLKVYDLPYTLTKGGPGYATNTITQSIIDRGIGQSKYGIGSALAVLFTLATFLVVLGQLGLFRIVSRRYSE